SNLGNAQPAQQALCKVRTEVVEVTRAMLDRSNANFMLWPPCVEVQRCSGCCNTKSLQCVPVVTHTRYLQVMKIEYINKRPAYAKAVVSVVDHVECRCQPAPAPRRKSLRRQHSHQHRNQTLSQGHGQGQVEYTTRTKGRRKRRRTGDISCMENTISCSKQQHRDQVWINTDTRTEWLRSQLD
uniref:Platelet-derived growth factor subunit B n=1 Tax=Anabas testudineus TaxID=64144 RepID=A0A3Q1IYC9_ANATE